MGWLQRRRGRNAAAEAARREKARLEEEESRQKVIQKARRRRRRKIILGTIGIASAAVAVEVLRQPAVYRALIPAVKPALGPTSRPNCLDYRIVGKPSLFAKTIDRIIPKNSPLAGKGDFILRQAVEFGIDPAVALAQFKIEGEFETSRISFEKRNPGNIRGKPRFEKRNGKTVRIDTFRKFKTWEDGIRAYFDLIANGSNYYQAGRFDAESIVPTYAPVADNNEPQEYIREMHRLANKYRFLEERIRQNNP